MPRNKVHASLESLANEVDLLREEKVDLEKRLCMAQLRGPNKPKFGEAFADSTTSELPPKLRAIVEDNRMLKDKARKYKERIGPLERQLETQTHKGNSLDHRVQELEKLVGECDMSPEEITELQAFRDEAKALRTSLAREQEKVEVLRKQVDVQRRRNKQDLAAKDRAAEEQAAIIAQLKSDLTEKDVDVRAARLEAREMRRRCDGAQRAVKRRQAELTGAASADTAAPAPPDKAGLKTRGHTRHMQATTKAETAATQQREASNCYTGGAGVSGRTAVQPEMGPSVHVMLCLIQPETRQARQARQSGTEYGTGRTLDPQERLEQTEAATVVQSSFRGHSARCEAGERRQDTQQTSAVLSVPKTEIAPVSEQVAAMRAAHNAQLSEEEVAIIKLQAQARGYLTRKHLRSSQRPDGEDGGQDKIKTRSTAMSMKKTKAAPSGKLSTAGTVGGASQKSVRSTGKSSGPPAKAAGRNH